MKIKILLVEDNQNALELISDLFKKHGYNTILASSIEAAISVLKSVEVNFVISDYRMPNGNGSRVLDFVNTLNTKPLFYFFSGECEGYLDNYLQNGVKAIFYKPSCIKKLIAEILKESQ